jgi:hypothetical protein
MGTGECGHAVCHTPHSKHVLLCLALSIGCGFGRKPGHCGVYSVVTKKSCLKGFPFGAVRRSREVFGVVCMVLVGSNVSGVAEDTCAGVPWRSDLPRRSKTICTNDPVRIQPALVLNSL